ncbi:MAG: ABC transporter ATP-binding protein/permease [Candidatus Ancillula sp.]|nr:ABC transporter ATP-binding protein/permease [Candidatus Ancillula sp.]
MLKMWKQYLAPYKKWVLIVLVLQTLQTACTIYLPNMNAHIIDNGVTKGDMNFIVREGSLMLVITALQVVLAIVATYFGAKTALRMALDIRHNIYEKVQSFSVREVYKFGAPTLITRSTNDIQQIGQISVFLMTMIVSAPIMLVGGVIMSLEQSVKLSGVIAATMPVIIIVAVIFLMKATPFFKVFQKATDRLNEVLREQISGTRVVRAFVKEKHEEQRFAEANDRLYSLNIKVGRLMSLLFPIFMLIINIAVLAIMWFGGILIDNGNMEIGAITAFITYIMYIMFSVLMSSMVFMFLPRAEVSAKRIQEVLDTETTVELNENPVHIDNPKGLVEFKDVAFRYAGASSSVLEGINFVAEPGKTTAIIGSTGSGKSTLLNLIPRLYDATGGQILFDGVNLRDLNLDELNSYISVIPQKSFLFSGTVADNILFGKDNATEEEMYEALEIAQAKQFLEEKSENNQKPLDLQVSQGGTNFSGGQRQRLSIARAVVRKPKVYLFDDSFSALDYTTDSLLRAALKTVTADATVIIVAQRVSTIRHADNILVINDGKIVGSGTHEDLIEKCKTYNEIVNSQLSAEEALR